MTLEVKGGDTVQVLYKDSHTKDKQTDVEVISEVIVVGDGVVQFKDGAFHESLNGVVLGKTANIEIVDADRVTENADRFRLPSRFIAVRRMRKLKPSRLS